MRMTKSCSMKTLLLGMILIWKVMVLLPGEVTPQYNYRLYTIMTMPSMIEEAWSK